MPYALSCSTCGYEATVRQLEAVIAHTEAHETAGADHDVTVAVVEDQPLFRGGVSDGWE